MNCVDVMTNYVNIVNIKSNSDRIQAESIYVNIDTVIDNIKSKTKILFILLQMSSRAETLVS